MDGVNLTILTGVLIALILALVFGLPHHYSLPPTCGRSRGVKETRVMKTTHRPRTGA